MTISTLIDKRDALEIVRDAITTILLAETTSQQALAADAMQDPGLWTLRVFDGASQPWSSFLQHPDQASAIPIVNVLVESTNVERAASDMTERQQRRMEFSIDCYGYGVSQGSTPGDHAAALEAQRCARLVRNILMAGNYTYLGLRGLVGRRMVRSLTMFDPPEASVESAVCVTGCRLLLEVLTYETSPQIIPVGIGSIRASTERQADGEVLFTAEWPTTEYVPPAPVPYVEQALSAVTIESLIDKQDTVELVRSAIANILYAEAASQQALAVTAGEDPRLWALRVFEERRQPWAQFLEAAYQQRDQVDVAPVVSVQLNATSLDPHASDPVFKQTYDATFHVAVFGYGLSEADGSGGHLPGDQRSTHEAQRAARLCRNILMAADYLYLGLRGAVGRRVVASTQSTQAQAKAGLDVATSQLTVHVRLIETSPQIELAIIGGVDAKCSRLSDGEVFFNASWDAS